MIIHSRSLVDFILHIVHNRPNQSSTLQASPNSLSLDHFSILVDILVDPCSDLISTGAKIVEVESVVAELSSFGFGFFLFFVDLLGDGGDAGFDVGDEDSV